MNGTAPRELTALLDYGPAAARNGGWAHFVQIHSKLLLQVSRAMSNDHDAAMDHYAHVLEQLGSDDFGRLRAYSPGRDATFTTWLAVVTRRLCLDRFRKVYGRTRDRTTPDRDPDLRRKLVDLVAEALDVETYVPSTVASPEMVLRSQQLTESLTAVRWPGAVLVDTLKTAVVDRLGHSTTLGERRPTWTWLEGGGSLELTSADTATTHTVSARMTLGPSVGTNRVVLAAPAMDSTFFTATAATPGPILFSSDRRRWCPGPACASALFLMDSDGSNAMVLLPSMWYGTEADWAPDGSRVVFVGGPFNGAGIDRQIYTATVGGPEQQLTSWVAPDPRGGALEYPDWSPDGLKIAFSIKQGAEGPNCNLAADINIYLIDAADGANQTKLTTSCGMRNTEPDWSPDGSQIVFTSRRDSPLDLLSSQRDIEIYVMNADGSVQTRLTNNVAQNDVSPRWNLDGTKIFFVRQVAGVSADGELWQMNPDGSSQELVQEFAEGINDFKFAPDGSLVITLWDEGLDVYRFDPITGQLMNLTQGDALDWGASRRP